MRHLKSHSLRLKSSKISPDAGSGFLGAGISVSNTTLGDIAQADIKAGAT
jgi:hypothetical protein